jgi:cytochrome c553
MFKIPTDSKDFSMDVDMLSKQKDNINKTTKIGLMGVCSNCHGHETNQNYKIF